jgi:hypothetical protein
MGNATRTVSCGDSGMPRVTAPVVISLALAIGAPTTVFSVFSAMLLGGMGFRDADRSVAL